MTRLIQITCVSLIVLALADGAIGQTAKIDPAWVYISLPLKWDTPPNKLGLEIKTSVAEIIILYPSGQLGVVACALIQQRDGKVMISHGDGEVVRSGTWASNSDSLTLTSHVVFRTIQRINSATGKTDPEPAVTEVLRKGSNSLQKDGKDRYVHLSKFDDFESLSLLANEREAGSDAKTK